MLTIRRAQYHLTSSRLSSSSSSTSSLQSLTCSRLLSNLNMAATQTVDTTQRLRALRELMKSQETSLTALVVPSEDQREHSCISYL
jgi:hypothetical protein